MSMHNLFKSTKKICKKNKFEIETANTVLKVGGFYFANSAMVAEWSKAISNVQAQLYL